MKTWEIKDKLSIRKPGIIEVEEASAVLIPLVEKNGELCLLFEKRADQIRQGGEICFPGGRMDKGESSERTVLREVEEELGLKPHLVTILGEFDTLHNYTGVTIHTVIGQIANSDVENIILQESEVAQTFLLPISFLLENEPYIHEFKVVADIGEDFPYDMVDSAHKYNWYKGKSTIPIWNYEGYCLWGLTARIVRHFLKSFFYE